MNGCRTVGNLSTERTAPYKTDGLTDGSFIKYGATIPTARVARTENDMR
jgi:hypothetical protein